MALAGAQKRGPAGRVTASDTGQQARQEVVAMDPERSEEGLTWSKSRLDKAGLGLRDAEGRKPRGTWGLLGVGIRKKEELKRTRSSGPEKLGQWRLPLPRLKK